MWPLWQGNVQRKYGRDKISVNPEGNPFRECPLTKTELALSHFFPGSGCDRKWFYHQRSDSISALPRLYWFICIIAKELHERTHIADQNFIRSVTKDYWRESRLRSYFFSQRKSVCSFYDRMSLPFQPSFHHIGIVLALVIHIRSIATYGKEFTVFKI